MYRLRANHRFVKLIRGFASEACTQTNSKDVFGTLSRSGSKSLAVRSVERSAPDDECGYEKEEFSLEPRKNLYYYKYEVSKYARQGSLGLRKALELFREMKSVARLTPTIDQFSPLIYGCAKAGYTRRAFELYEESHKYIGKPSNSIVTCLINSCAESPFPEYGLKRLDWFRKHLKINYNFTFNKIHYHSAIKAYGKLGQLKQASELVQEMIENNIQPDTETFNMLFMGCASDEEAGCTIALRVYKRMKFYGIQPDINSYRLLLRCIRDCGMGSPELVEQTIGELPAMTSFNQRLKYKKKFNRRQPSVKDNFEWVPLIQDAGVSLTNAIEPPSATAIDVKKLKLLEQPKNMVPSKSTLIKFATNKALLNLSETPARNPTQIINLLSEDHLNLVSRIEGIQFDRLQNGPNRMMLFGGIHGYLQTMVDDDCPPDSKTFSLLLDCLKHTKLNHLEYLRLAHDYSIKRDLLFYDLLIRHIGESFKDKNRLERALVIIEEMHKDGIRPNISTFESLALCCGTQEQGLKLLSDIEQSGFTVSKVLIKRLWESALYNLDFKHLNTMIEISKKYNYKPVKCLIEELEEKRLYAHDIILQYENNVLKPADVPEWLNQEQIKNFDKFNKFLGNWLKKVEMNAEDEHPWEQFHVESTSKRQGFVKFAETFKALNKAKEEALRKGESFGNLAAKSGLAQLGPPSIKSEKMSQRSP